MILTGLNKLSDLDYGSNFLMNFDAFKNSYLPQMVSLKINNNSLVDIDEQSITEKFPELVYLDINGNNLDCDRLSLMYGYFLRKGIVLKSDEETERQTIQSNIEGINCLTENERIQQKIDPEIEDILKKLKEIQDEVSDMYDKHDNFNATLQDMNHDLNDVIIPEFVESLNELENKLIENTDKTNRTATKLDLLQSHMTKVENTIVNHSGRIAKLEQLSTKCNLRITDLVNESQNNLDILQNLDAILDEKTSQSEQILVISIILLIIVTIMAVFLFAILINILCVK